MPPKILRRCDCCKNYHASFLVKDPQGKTLYYCFRCFKAWQAHQPPASDPTPPASNQPPPAAV